MYTAQDINEALAKGVFNKDLFEEIKKGDSYLKTDKKVKPEWIDNFLVTNKNKLVETICRANRKEGLASLSGYSEGYFNEIIQNANDLHCGNWIKFDVTKEVDTYRLNCSYEDKGFSISNIYGFLNREMSDKDNEKGQTGKYGIGIKSFFQFVDSLEICSNVNMKFVINRKDKEYFDIFSIVEKNENWDKKTTQLKISYSEKTQSHFNLEKLSKLINYLSEDEYTDLNQLLFDGDNDEILFDIRSLIFMSKHQNSISKLFFSGEMNEIEVDLMIENKEDYVFEDSNYELNSCKLFLEDDEYKFLLCTHLDKTFAFALFDEDKIENRYYSTYLTKSTINDFSFQICIDSRFANMHRNDLGDSSDSINKAKKSITNSMEKIMRFLSSETINNSRYLLSISIIFYDAILHELKADKEYADSVFCNALTTRHLPITSPDKIHNYVINRKYEEEYERTTFMEGNIKENLVQCFQDVFENKEILYLNELKENGISDLFIESYEYLGQFLNQEQFSGFLGYFKLMNYFPNVKSFIKYLITKDRSREEVYDFEIDQLLKKYDKKYENFILKIIGRYCLNQAIGYDGKINPKKLSFREYLFNSHNKGKQGLLEKLQNETYDTKYKSLKTSLLMNRYTDSRNKKNKYLIPFKKPTSYSTSNWNGKYNYSTYYLKPHFEQISTQDKCLFLLQIINEPSLYRNILKNKWGYGYNTSKAMLFELKARDFNEREYDFVYSTIIKQQLINVESCFSIEFQNFDLFNSTFMLVEELEEFINIIHFNCEIKTTKSSDLIDNVIPKIFKNINLYDSYYEQYELNIKQLVEDSRSELPNDEKYKFIQTTTGLKLRIFKFNSESRRDLAFFMYRDNIWFNYKGKDKFKKIGNFKGNERDVYIFYDNFKGNLDDVIKVVLKEINVGESCLKLVESFISPSNSIIALDYDMYENHNLKCKRKLNLDWQLNGHLQFQINYDYYLIKRILESRGNYEKYCPMCGLIQDSQRKLVVFANQNIENKEQYPYIVTICCENCFVELKNTLKKVNLVEGKIKIERKFVHGQNESLEQLRIIDLSPINIQIINEFNKVDEY